MNSIIMTVLIAVTSAVVGIVVWNYFNRRRSLKVEGLDDVSKAMVTKYKRKKRYESPPVECCEKDCDHKSGVRYKCEDGKTRGMTLLRLRGHGNKYICVPCAMKGKGVKYGLTIT